jgi:hypothetical protein
MYIRLYDLIVYAYCTWNFSFEDIQSDLIDIVKLAIEDGVTQIGLSAEKVVYINEYDLIDLVDYLEPHVIDILQEIQDYDYEY